MRLKISAVFAATVAAATADTSDASPAQSVFTRSVTIPASKPTKAIAVPANFVSFGFETAFLNDYANDFSENLVGSIGKRMSAPLIIRVGGTSGRPIILQSDQVTFSPGQSEARKCLRPVAQCPDGSGAYFSLGPSYFDAFTRFKGAHMTFQAPLGKNDATGDSPANYTATVDYVKRAYANLGAGRVAGIAIGNEVSFYINSDAYVKTAKALEANITRILSLNDDQSKIFEVLDLPNGAVQGNSPFTVSGAFEAGLDSNHLVKYAATHYYQVHDGIDNDQDLQSKLMNHGVIVASFKPHAESISYLNANYPGVDYILSETGGVLAGSPDYSSAFAATLWSVDFQLHAMSHGAARVVDSQRPAAVRSPWVPVNTSDNDPSPSVRAPFYASPFIADFVGKSQAAQSVIEIDLNSDVLSAYAMYEGNSLARVALVNLRVWSANQTADRGGQAFALNVNNARGSVRVGHLHSPRGTVAKGWDFGHDQNITWAGQQWAYSQGRGVEFPENQFLRNVTIRDGTAVVHVPDSEAAIVFFD